MRCADVCPLQVDEEKARVEEVLRRGEEMLLQIPDEDRREELRRNLLRLQMQYTTVRVRAPPKLSLTLLKLSLNHPNSPRHNPNSH